MKDVLKIAGSVIISALVIVGLYLAYFTMYPMWLEFRRNSIQESQGYVEGQRTALIQVYDEYTGLYIAPGEIENCNATPTCDLEEWQNNVRIARNGQLMLMREISDKLPENEVPSQVRILLEQQ